MGVPDRIRWAVEVLGLVPTDRVLEVGGGTGASAALVCGRLSTGRMLAVDRSRAATGRIERACHEHVASGRLVVVTAPLDRLEVVPASVEVAFSVDVNVFWTTDAEAELRVLRHVLVPGGRLALLYGTAGPHADRLPDRILGPVAAHVRDAGFVDVEVRLESEGSGVLARSPR